MWHFPNGVLTSKIMAWTLALDWRHFPLSLSMAHADLTATFASFFVPGSASASWTKLGDNHAYSQLSSKYWGNKIEEEARELQHTVDVDRTNDIGPECYGLDLGIEHLSRSKLWVRQDYIRIYNYCSKRYEERPFNMMTRIPRSVVITGQPGVGVLLSSDFLCISNSPSCGKVNHIGSTMLSVVVSANRSHFFGMEVASASYLPRTECFNKNSRMFSAETLRRTYGHSSIPMDVQLVSLKTLFTTQSSLLCSPLLRSQIDGRLLRSVRVVG
jgi:hypothetical protein